MSITTVEISQKLLNGEIVLSDKPGGRSKVWAVFAKMLYPDGEEVKEYVFCKSCEKLFKYNSIQTSNLLKHKCYVVRTLINPDNTTSVSEDDKSIDTVVENPANNLPKLLTKWILKDCRPYNMIQNEGLKAIFKELIRLGSKFGGDSDLDTLLPSFSDIEKNVYDIYDQCFERIRAEVALIKDNGFGLTTSICTDSLSKKNYIAVTIHYLKNGELICHLLGFKLLEDEKLTNQSIGENIKQILGRFDCKLSSKSLVVIDGDCDANKAIPDAQNLPCISQLLSNALQKSIEEVADVTDIITACLKLINFLKKIELNALFNDELQTSYTSRWLTTFKMLKLLEANWSDIETELHNRNESERISTINLHHLKAVTKTFQPFEEAIETLEDDSNVTLHLVIAYLHELKKSCDTNDSEFRDFDFIESLKENIRFYLEKIFTENITILHKLALFLFPPTNKLLQFSEKDRICIEGECLRLMKSFKGELKPLIKQEPEPPTTPLSKRRKLFSDFVETDTNRDPNELIIHELHYYKNTRVVDSADFDVFTWWEVHKDNFPLLCKLSCTILATPATSAASKRIFSDASSLLYAESNQGSKEVEIEKILFIKSNAERDEVDKYFTDETLRTT